MDKGYTIFMKHSRHAKRFHNDENDNGNNSESITSSGNALITPTVTVTIVQTTVTSTITASSEASPVVTHSAQTPVSSKTSDNGEMRKDDDASPTASALPSSQSPSGLSVGAIVGIVLAVILFLAACGVFWFRRRSIASRLEKRQWNKQQQKTSSFLFIESKDSSQIRPFNFSLRPYRGKDIVAPSVNMTQPVHVRLHYIPYPAPPRPPQVAGAYDDTIPTRPVTTSLSKVSTQLLSPPAPPSLNPFPSLSKQTEAAKVRATFIPTLPDELTIGIGEMVLIHMKYDDDWCLCSNARGEMGMLPLECLDRASQFPREKSANEECRRSVRSLPSEITLQIFSHLPYEGLVACSLVNRRWHVLADDQSQWARLCRERNWEWRQPSHTHPAENYHDGVNVSDDEGVGDSDVDGDNGEFMINDVETVKAELTFVHAELDSGFVSTSFSSLSVVYPEPSTSDGRYTVYPKSSPEMSRSQSFAEHLAPAERRNLAQDLHLTPDYKLLYKTHMKLYHRFCTSSYRLSVLQTRGAPNNAHTNTIYCLQLYTYPSGLQVLFTGSRDRTVREWNLTTGLVERVIGGIHTASVLSVCVHGGYLASAGSDYRVVVWDLEKNQLHKVLMEHTDSVLCVRFDDKRLVSCSKDHTVRTYSFPDLTPQYVLGAHRAAVNAVSISQNLIASGSGDKSIKIWDANTGNLLRTLELHHNRGFLG
ncbi:hypothetical protein C0993_011911 [Termitomyces sp. T159_Od127]|nr:hypothetical protein C0993_011911 [Termitomyces sp. T159_Od127]